MTWFLELLPVACVACVAHQEAWQFVHPQPTGNTLNAVWGQGREVWVVGDHGTILYSADAGASFQPRPSGTTEDLYAIRGCGGDDLIAVGHTDTILQSRDRGTTWTRHLDPRKHFSSHLSAIACDGRAIVLSGYDQIVRSTDGGTTWTETDSPYHWSRLAAVGPGVLVGATGTTLQHSADGGASWTTAKVPFSAIELAAAPAVLYAAGEAADSTNGIYRSTDLGEHWTRLVTLPSIPALWLAGDRIYRAGSDGVARSDDGGATWLPLAIPGRYRAVWAEGETVVAVGDSGTLVHSNDGGRTFGGRAYTETLTSVTGSADGTTVIAVGDAGTVMRSGDGGKTFQVLPGAAPKQLAALWTEDGNTLVAVGDHGLVARSADGGRHWTTSASGVTVGLAALWGRHRRLWAAGAGTVLRSDDAGVTWVIAARDIVQVLPAGNGEDIAVPIKVTFIAVMPDGAIVAGGGGTRVSVDGGGHFSEMPAPDWAGGVTAVCAIGGDLLGVTGTRDLARSSDDGRTWRRVTTSHGTFEPAVTLCDERELVLAAGFPGEKAGGTSSSSVIERSGDGGTTWSATKIGERFTGFWADGRGRLYAVGAGESIVVLSR